MNKDFLYLPFAAALVLGVWIRLSHPGWFLIICGIPLLGMVIVHALVQLSAIGRASPENPSFSRWILLSNLFFFLGFALQPEAGFGSPPGDSWPDEALSEPFLFVSTVSFIALIASWIVLISTKRFLKSGPQEGSSTEKEPVSHPIFQVWKRPIPAGLWSGWIALVGMLLIGHDMPPGDFLMSLGGGFAMVYHLTIGLFIDIGSLPVTRLFPLSWLLVPLLWFGIGAALARFSKSGKTALAWWIAIYVICVILTYFTPFMAEM